MEVTGTSSINVLKIPNQSRVGQQISSVIGTSSADTNASVVVSVQDWSENTSPPSDDIVLEYYYAGNDNNELRFNSLPDRYTEHMKLKIVSELTLNFKRVIDHSTSTEYIFDDSGKLVPEQQPASSGDTQIWTSASQEQKYCPECGEIIENGEANFCLHCGTEL